MPRRGIQSTRQALAPDVTAGAVQISASKEKQLDLLKRRPDKPKVIALRTHFLKLLAPNIPDIYAQMMQVIRGIPPEVTEAIGKLEAMLDKTEDKAERNWLTRAICNLTDQSKMQQSRERMLTTLIDKLLVTTREGDAEDAADQLPKGVAVNLVFGPGLLRGANEPEAKQIAEAIEIQVAETA